MQDKESSYNVKKWEKDHRRRVGILKNISEYPYRESRRALRSTSYSYQTKRPSSLPTRQQPRGRKGVIVRQAEALDENRIVHFKKGKQLGNGYYIVEISSNSTSLFIAAYDVESSESFLITLPDK